MAIRIYLDEVLKARHMTSKELCRWIGITEANLSVLRSGKAKGVRFGTLNKICYYLQCDVGEILRFDGHLQDEGNLWEEGHLEEEKHGEEKHGEELHEE